MKIGDLVTWKKKPIHVKAEIGIIIEKHKSYRGKYWYVRFMTGGNADRHRVLCNEEHIRLLEIK